MSPLRCRPVALLLLVLLGGCYTWRATTVSPRQVIEGERPTQIRITAASGDQWILREPELRGDSVAGTAVRSSQVEIEPRGGAFGGQIEVRGDTTKVIPLTNVRRIELRRWSAWRTVALAPAVLLVVAVISCGGSCTP